MRFPTVELVLASMYEFRLVVQYSNGELEGFAGSSLSEKGAHQDAERKALDKIEELQRSGRSGRFLGQAEYEKLSPEKKQALKQDWEMSLQGKGE
jgi:hypothetical protein